MTMRIDQALLGAVADLLDPLIAGSRTDDDARRLLKRLGWDLSSTSLSTAELRAAFAHASEVWNDIAALVDVDDPSLQRVLALLTDGAQLVRAVISGVRSVPSTLPATDLETLAGDLAADLLETYLRTYAPRLRAMLLLGGITELRPNAPLVSPDGVTVRSALPRLAVYPERLVSLLRDPAGYLRGRYRLDRDRRRAATEVADLIGPLVIEALSALDISASYDVPLQLADDATANAAKHLLYLALPAPADAEGLPTLRFATGLIDEDEGTLAAIATAAASLTLSRSLPTGSIAATLRATAHPLQITTRGISMVNPEDPFLLEINITADAGDDTGTAPVLRLGSATGPQFQVNLMHITVEADPARVGVVTVAADLSVALVVQASATDGFLSSILPQKPTEARAQLHMTWDPARGLRISGGGGLAFDLAVGIEIGPVILRAFHLALTARDGVTLHSGLDIDAQLGPFHLSIRELGLDLNAVVAPSGGSMGIVDVQPRLKPPVGVGLAIASTAVAGGGFLAFDSTAGQYTGIFELTIVGKVSVKAIAIITTKLPDGSPGFALLIVITADGFTPIQLGMGFSLTGIGGLLALNHTVNADVIRDGLQSGVLDSVLFVKDPVKNANRVLSTLNKIFPLAPDRLLIGPLAEISWGSPTIVKLRVALLLEVPQPVRAVLLAALSMLLPRPEDPVLELHVDAVGVLDLNRSELALDAALHDSRLLKFALTGDMAVRLNWGSDPMFVLSVGGFHPKFTPPRGLRPLNRLSLTLSSGDNPRVRFEAYLALTSNTIQMGARVSVFYKSGGFGIDGGGSFDALIQWSPFGLDVALAAWVRVFTPVGDLLAVSLALEVTGPRRWHITGQASVHILWINAKIPIDIAMGPAQTTTDPVGVVNVVAVMWEQISDRKNWHAVLSTDAIPGVTLAQTAGQADSEPLVAHPLAGISVRQQVVPLSTLITRIGARLPAEGPRSYDIDITAPAGIVSSPLDDLFAPAQYNDVPDDVRITEPSFVPMPAGVTLSPQNVTTIGPWLGCDLAFDTLDVTHLDQPATPGATVAAVAGLEASPAAPAVAPMVSVGLR